MQHKAQHAATIRMRILIAAVFYGLAILNLMWFPAALRTTLADVVLSLLPRAMLIMGSAFGLWRAGMFSDALFAAAVAAVILG